MPRPIDHPWFDSSDAPLYRWNVSGEPKYAEIEACCRAREEWARTITEPVAWVVDLTGLGNVRARERQLFAEHLERFRPFDERWTVASAIVAPNAWLRGLVTAVFWLAPPKFPNRVFADVASAYEWARARLREGPAGARQH